LTSTATPQIIANRRIAITAGYYAAFIVLGLASASLGPTLTGLAENTQTQLSQISYLFLARSVGYLLGSLLGGRLYDRISGHWVMAIGLIGIAISLSLTPLIPLLWLLIGVMVLLGISEGSLDVGANTLLVWLHRDQVNPFMNALHFFFGLGAFISPIIVAQAMLISGDIAWAYWMLAITALAPAAWLWLQPSPLPISDKKSGLRPIVNAALLGLIMVLFFLYVGAEVGYAGWVYTYSTTMKLGDPARAAYLTSSFWGALTLGRLLSIPIAARFRPRTILLVDLVGCLLSTALILIWQSSQLALWAGTIGLGLFMASFFPTLMNFAGRRMTITGAVTSLLFVGASTGGMFFPWFIGQLFEPFGPTVVLKVILLDLLLALGVFSYLVIRYPGAAEKPGG